MALFDFIDQELKVAQVGASGEFRDHTTVGNVQCHLARDEIAEQDPLLIMQGHRRFIATGFYGKKHSTSIVPGSNSQRKV